MDEDPRDSLVFITYTDSKNGRNHDSQRRRVVRTQAYHFARAKSGHQANTGQKRVSQRADSSSQGDHPPQTSAIEPHTIIKKSCVPLLISDRPSYIAEMGYDGWEALNFYHQTQRRSSIALNPDGDCLAFTMSDPIALRAHLYLIASDMENEGHDRGNYLSARFRSATVQAVIRGMRALSGAPSDSLIYAVAVLTMIESIVGEGTTADAHYRGLRKMLALRGGMSDFQEHKWMLRTILWSRRCHCLRRHAILSLPMMPADTAPSYDPFSVSISCEIQEGQGFPGPGYLQYGGVLSHELKGIAADLHTLSEHPTETSAQRERMSDAIYEIEYKLLLLAQKHLADLPGLTGLSVTLSRAYHLAAQLYAFLVLREIPTSASVVTRFSTALATETESLGFRCFIYSVNRLSDPWKRLLLWVGTILALGSRDSEHYSASLSLLGLFVSSLQLSEFAALRKALRDVAWMSDHREDELRSIWDDIGPSHINDAHLVEIG